jgi:hypothetical protein
MNPIYDPVILLLDNPYSRWSMDNKNDLLRQGKPTPHISCLTKDKKGSKVFCRSFNPSMYSKHSWLCGSHYTQKLFCWPCLLLSVCFKSVWVTVGFNDFKNLSRSIQRHESSKDHIYNHLNFKNLEKNTATIADALTEHGKLHKKYFNENVRLNRLFMENLVDLVLYYVEVLLDLLKILSI